ncbi:MAG: hypothetical protein AMJ93_14145 [Anaerolineae bacterium SM23_84]|nr:MAG: hypothetical protein AMJ93_14145 [Anaerolineae bacterium SM23_84]
MEPTDKKPLDQACTEQCRSVRACPEASEGTVLPAEYRFRGGVPSAAEGSLPKGRHPPPVLSPVLVRTD